MQPSIHFPKQNYPKLSPQGFLERAFIWLDSGIDVGIFYAALELRKCYESIWLKHGMASDDASDEFTHMNWKPEELASKLNHEFVLEIDVNKSYKFTFDPANPNLTMGYFLAMPKELADMKDSINEYIHAQCAIRIGDQKWYPENQELLLNFAILLIPHASSKNSLIGFLAPNIQLLEMNSEQIKPLLIKTLPKIRGPWS